MKRTSIYRGLGVTQRVDMKEHRLLFVIKPVQIKTLLR